MSLLTFSATLSPKYIDTVLPNDVDDRGFLHPTKSFHQLKLELAIIAGRVLDCISTVTEVPYQAINTLQVELNQFERDVPYDLRCRTAYLSMPSLCADTTRAGLESPEVSKRDLAKTLQVGQVPKSS